jgi:aarF domain-containing kinase
VPGDL